MTKARKRGIDKLTTEVALFADGIDGIDTLTYTFLPDGTPFSRTITRFGGSWSHVSLLQPIAIAAVATNLYEKDTPTARTTSGSTLVIKSEGALIA